MESNNERIGGGGGMDRYGKQFQREDLLQYSNIFSSEFNNKELHDRILVLKVLQGDHGLIPQYMYPYSKDKVTEDTPVNSEEEIKVVSENNPLYIMRV